MAYKMLFVVCCFVITSCSEDTVNSVTDFTAVETMFGNRIDPTSLDNYANQVVPDYIGRDNTAANAITDEGATLGRVLFYDTSLSVDDTIACASCHQQSSAFSDTDLQSTGVNGVTGRHSMRLVNARFAQEVRFFWDERAASLEEQTTQPIQDHVEMGFSGQDGNSDFAGLITKLEAIAYYQELFTFVYGDAQITEARIQDALAQFVRSIQSFDSKYDTGRAQVQNDGQDFPNFTAQENTGKQLFMRPPQQGGAGCAGCHRLPEFDIDPNSRNNGVVGLLGDVSMIDTTITRAPSLRDLVGPSGQLNGPLMHDGSIDTIAATIEHYNSIPIIAGNNNLDQRLRNGGPGEQNQQGQQLNLTTDEKAALEEFLLTLTGQNMYTDERWSDPFAE